MKTGIKKYLALFMILALTGSFLACGTEEQPTSEASLTETKEETTAETTESREEPTEESKLEGKELLKQYANEFLRITEGKELNKYDAQVAAYEQESKEKGKIIFFGSSLFTRWTKDYGALRELEEDLVSESGEQVCLNHGIGGSNIAHNVYYYKRMVKNYEPKALALSVLANYTTDYNFSQEDVMFMLEYFLEMTRQDFPGIRFYLAVKRTESKQKLIQMIEEYAAEHTDVTIVELNFQERYEADKEGHPDSDDFIGDVYVEDKVHLTPLGYKYYTQMWREAMADELK